MVAYTDQNKEDILMAQLEYLIRAHFPSGKDCEQLDFHETMVPLKIDERMHHEYNISFQEVSECYGKNLIEVIFYHHFVKFKKIATIPIGNRRKLPFEFDIIIDIEDRNKFINSLSKIEFDEVSDILTSLISKKFFLADQQLVINDVQGNIINKK